MTLPLNPRIYLQFFFCNEIKHAARVLSRYRAARRTRILRIRPRLTVHVKKSGQNGRILAGTCRESNCADRIRRQTFLIYSFQKSPHIILRRNYALTLIGLIFTPGPIVGATETDFRYWPFSAAGLALLIAAISVWKLSFSCSSVKEALPITT